MENAQVLVVEDDERERRAICDFLRSKEIELHFARDGVEALYQISRVSYDVILLDVMMPKISGVDVLDSLRALMSDPSVKAVEKAPAVIVVTAASPSTLPDDAIQRRYARVRAIFRKPVDLRGLSACLDQQLR